MIISHKHKFAFFRAPKTGTTTAQFMLRMSNVWDESTDILTQSIGHFESVNEPSHRNDPEVHGTHSHTTPAIAIRHGLITLEQLREYDCYCFLREPYSRYLSASVHLVGRFSTPNNIHALMENTLVGHELHPKARAALSIVNRHQIDYFFVDGEQVVEALNFADYTNECRRLLKQVGSIEFPVIPKMNVRPAWKKDFTYEEFWTDNIKTKFAVDYADDIAFYNKMLDIWNK